ncbi:Recombinase [uncultured delta proteobacterium]|uniref:Recombinase n=1 Tax=uncultured delta proteobacterium TaxID=34034 RepID=A0A212K787_9DELT|nr:Recombinase [uncultured delta proteobacterium]
MPQAGTAYTIGEIKKLRLRGAMYIRMSTELQVESPENQGREIRAYADSYGIEIVSIYTDLGVSGMKAEGREQFQAMLDDVESGRNEYSIVLYLDDSRWGRFVDSGEAEYYRMRLKLRGVICQACDKPLTMTATFADRLLTMVKDESASDYCRQLSQKVFVGQRNLILKGYRQGGPAGFGLRRVLVDESGNPKQELTIGQRKSLQTERVVLAPGPGAEQETVRWMYDQFIAGARETEIADMLNAEGCLTDFGRFWTRGSVREVLTNEKYIGNNLYNRRSGKLKSKPKPNPESEWIRKERAFQPVVDAEQFYTVQRLIRERHKKISDIEMLERLRSLHAQTGRLSAMIIDESENMPPSSLYSSRFGGLLRAYTLIGYMPERDYRYVEINQRLRILHGDIVSQTVSDIEELCGRRICIDPETSLLELNHNLFISIVISRCFLTSFGMRRWKIRFDTGLHPDITVAVRMDAANENIHDYYILPALEFGNSALRLQDENADLLDSFRADSLDYLLGMSINISLDKAV